MNPGIHFSTRHNIINSKIGSCKVFFSVARYFASRRNSGLRRKTRQGDKDRQPHPAERWRREAGDPDTGPWAWTWVLKALTGLHLDCDFLPLLVVQGGVWGQFFHREAFLSNIPAL